MKYASLTARLREERAAKNRLTRQQRYAAYDFIKVADTNGLRNVRAALGSSDELVRSHKVREIRVIKDAIAEGWDELGNRTILTRDLRILQLVGAEA